MDGWSRLIIELSACAMPLSCSTLYMLQNQTRVKLIDISHWRNIIYHSLYCEFEPLLAHTHGGMSHESGDAHAAYRWNPLYSCLNQMSESQGPCPMGGEVEFSFVFFRACWITYLKLTFY